MSRKIDQKMCIERSIEVAIESCLHHSSFMLFNVFLSYFLFLVFNVFLFFSKYKIEVVFIISNPSYDDAHIKPYKDRRHSLLDLGRKLDEIQTIFL